MYIYIYIHFHIYIYRRIICRITGQFFRNKKWGERTGFDFFPTENGVKDSMDLSLVNIKPVTQTNSLENPTSVTLRYEDMSMCLYL